MDRSIFLPLEGLKVYPVELMKGTDIKNITTIKQTWINFLKSSTDVSKPEEIEEVNEAYKEMLTTAGSDAYRNYVDALEKGEELIRNEIYLAKKDALAKGLAKGLAEGKREQAIKTAKSFLKMGLSIEQVAQGTGLTVNEVKKL